MRPVPIFAQPSPSASDAEKIRWLIDMVKQLSDASQTEANAIADPFTITNATATRTLNTTTGAVSSQYTVTNGVTTRALNVSTATANDVAKVLGTLIGDIASLDTAQKVLATLIQDQKRRGMNRASG